MVTHLTIWLVEAEDAFIDIQYHVHVAILVV